MIPNVMFERDVVEAPGGYGNGEEIAFAKIFQNKPEYLRGEVRQ
jgi:hypothetical protein